MTGDSGLQVNDLHGLINVEGVVAVDISIFKHHTKDWFSQESSMDAKSGGKSYDEQDHCMVSKSISP